MRVLICGGRSFHDRGAMHVYLSSLASRLPISSVLTGGAPGADALAGEWARSERIPLAIMKADWAVHGRAAGPIRNQRMLDEGRPDIVVAFPGGRGTADMIRRAEMASVRVLVFPKQFL